MKTSKLLASYLIMLCISVVATGCNKSSPQISSSLPVTEKLPGPVDPVKDPEVYDVVCFEIKIFMKGAKCSPDDIYKVPRNTEVTVGFKQETSVQNGTETKLYIASKGQAQKLKITVPEMESLASQGANVYAIDYGITPFLVTNDQQQFIEVKIFNNNIGAFKIFDQDKTKVVFKTGDTKVRVEIPE